MKVLHLATHDCFGGAARAAFRQHRALRGAGIDSRMLVRHAHSDDEGVAVFTGDRGLRSRVERTIRRGWINFLEKRSRAGCSPGLRDPRADLLRGVVSEMAGADVLNLHKTEQFVDLAALFRSLPASKPVVLTMHDLSPITGGCDYPGSCGRFSAECGECPILNSHADSDYSRRIFHLRRCAYGSRLPEKFVLVANSQWTFDKLKRSGLAADRRAELIHYCLDLDVYHPHNRLVSREALGIRPDESVICFAAHHLGLKHKGAAELNEALSGLKINGPVRLVTMGSGRLEAPAQFKHTHFGRIESDALQSMIYRAADVFVIPSLEEAFGQTALEAAACGTVVAGFAVGGIGDIVQNGLNGLLVERGDSKALGESLFRLLADRDLGRCWRERCVSWTKERFSCERNASAYLKLYESLMSSGCPAKC